MAHIAHIMDQALAMLSSEPRLGMMLLVLRPWGDATALDFVVLDQAEPVAMLDYSRTGPTQRIQARPIEGGGDPVRALRTCLGITILEAAIVTSEPVPALDALTEPVPATPPEGAISQGWVYHLGRDAALAVYQCFGSGTPGPFSPLEVRRGTLR